MQVSQIPTKFNIPFANNAGGSFTRPIPQASQIGIQGGAASLTDGFPPLCFQPIASGGIPPWGQDFNGLLNQSTAWNQWHSAGGPILYDSVFQAAIGGYPNGAIVGSNVVQGNYWMSTVDNNATNPDNGGAGWINPPGLMGTGHWQHRPVSSPIPGWIISNGTTIGNAGSGASQRANADCAFAYYYLWNNFSNVQCPVIGGRGASAFADFTANKPITTYNMQGTGVIGVDGMGGTPTGQLAGVPVTTGGPTIPASIVGENLHLLLLAELTQHSHGYNDPGHAHVYNAVFQSTQAPGSGGPSLWQATTTPVNTSTNATNITIANQGGSTAHNNVQRSSLVYWFMKL